MKNRIILGYPYSGAFYWLLSAEEWRKSPLKIPYRGSHSYYKTLYGKDHYKIIDETVSLCILYKEIFLSPADCYMPKHEQFYDGKEGKYSNTELGIYTNWSWRQETNELFKLTELLLKDHFIHKYMLCQPLDSRRQIVNDALVQLHISEKYDATIIACEGYLKMCERIQNLLKIHRPGQSLNVANRTLKAINTVFDLASLKFSLNSIDEFVVLRTSKALKKYGESFRKYIGKLPTGELDEHFLFESMSEAINTDEISKKISGGLGITATLTNVISLVPYLGSVAGAAGIASDITARTINKISEKDKWWLLGPEVAKLLTKKRIEERTKKFRKEKGII